MKAAEDLGRLQADAARREEELRAEQERLSGELADTRTALRTERDERTEIEGNLRAKLEGQEKALAELRSESEARLDAQARELHEERRHASALGAIAPRGEGVGPAPAPRGDAAPAGARDPGRHQGRAPARPAHGDHARRAPARASSSRARTQTATQLLDLVCHEGFEHDPSDSAVAQRFAREVIAKDQTIREDDEPDIAPERRTPADDEIQNLLAIPIYIADEFSGVVVLANKEGGFSAVRRRRPPRPRRPRGGRPPELDAPGAASLLVRRRRCASSPMRSRRRTASCAATRTRSRATSRPSPTGMGLEPKQREQLVYSSLLHDVGQDRDQRAHPHEAGRRSRPRSGASSSSTRGSATG